MRRLSTCVLRRDPKWLARYPDETLGSDSHDPIRGRRVRAAVQKEAEVMTRRSASLADRRRLWLALGPA